ncbi:beta-L-arabinofuranosidase domain-containing protein [Paenibacillus favisporus]|uniref:beta-L-arabinofuranosidase domain-containing protein n=1 Tax=Paenibacillus favisporus TaxID=221028 RepID=UPI003D2ADAB3
MSSIHDDEMIVLKDMEALYLGNLGTVEFDINLPREGKYGSEISWQSGDSRFIKDDGKVARPKYGLGTRTVPLIATFRHGESVKEQVYHVTILEEENNIKVSRIYPISLRAELGEVVYFPSVAVVETEEHEVITHAVNWVGGEERVFQETGPAAARGFLKDTEIPVTAEILVQAKVEQEKMDPLPTVLSFSPGAVRLGGETAFQAAQNRSLAFLKSVNDDQMLYNFRAAAGLDTKDAPEMLGWDSPDCLLRGHTSGHYLSALALCYAATGDRDIKKKAEYMIGSLEECQRAFSTKPGYHVGFLSGYSEEQFDRLESFTRYPEIWAPYYTLHKILAGLLDVHRLLDSDTALGIADRLGDWVYHRLGRLPNQVLKTMWSMYIAGEFGGMNDSLAELYQLTRKPSHLAAAKWFDNDRLFVPMQERIDALGGLHANQHIPQAIGALNIFRATGEKKYYEIAHFFWHAVTNAHIYSIGGTGEGEMFRQAGKIGEYLSDKTAETCASYNMLKLTKELFGYEPAAKYMDYYERTMFNHILASGDSKPTGGSTYFMPLEPGGRKSFDSTSNTCCHGTGLENHFKYPEAIYFYDEQSLFVNLFVSSTLDWAEKGITIALSAQKHEPGQITLRIQGDGRFILKIRRPYWSPEGGIVEINCLQVDDMPGPDGYWSLDRDWKDGDEIRLRLDCRIRLESAPDRKECVSLAYGPYILAAVSDSKEYLRLPLQEGDLDSKFVKETGPHGLQFRYIKDDVTFISLADVQNESYHVYFLAEGSTMDR